MKKSLVLTVLCAVIFSFSAHAQVFTIGPKFGVSSTNIKPSESATEFAAGDSELSYHGGLFARIKIGGFFVQPELYFNSVNGSYVSTSGATDQEYKFNKSKVDLPVLFGWKIGPLRLNAGPVASFNTNTEVEADADAVIDDYKSAIFAYQAGVGLDISKLTLDVRYEGNLSDQGSFSADQGSFKVNQILFSVGFKLL